MAVSVSADTWAWNALSAYLHISVGQLLEGAGLESEGFQGFVQFGNVRGSNFLEDVVRER